MAQLPGLDIRDAACVIDVFDRAAQVSLDSPLRRGSADHLPAHGRLVMSGDLHDHGPNLEQIIKLAHLDRDTDHHLILHEVIHGRRFINGMDLSVRTLAKVAALKLQYPAQVHAMLGNHEMAQLQRTGISKEGINVVEAYTAGIEFLYVDQADAVTEAMNRFIRSLLLAVRCANGVFCSHSLPSPRNLTTFDSKVIERLPTVEDMAFNGSAYQLVWGRNQTEDVADDLSEEWEVDLFLMGHQPAEMGHELIGRSMLVLASDHEHGVALPVDLSREYHMEELIAQIVLLGAVG